jgi:hypothetical protein
MNRTLCVTQNSVFVQKTMVLSNLNEDISLSCSLIFTENILDKSEEYYVYVAGNLFFLL